MGVELDGRRRDAPVGRGAGRGRIRTLGCVVRAPVGRGHRQGHLVHAWWRRGNGLDERQVDVHALGWTGDEGTPSDEALRMRGVLGVERLLPYCRDGLDAPVEDVCGREEGQALVMVVLAVQVEVLGEVRAGVLRRPELAGVLWLVLCGLEGALDERGCRCSREAC